MLLRIDQGSTVALHDQLAGQIRSAIADGTLEAGERLPPARELATSLGVNVHTVLRSLQALRDEGLLDIRRGRGVTVTGAAPKLAPVTDLARAFIAGARRLGMSDGDIRRLVEETL